MTSSGSLAAGAGLVMALASVALAGCGDGRSAPAPTGPYNVRTPPGGLPISFRVPAGWQTDADWAISTRDGAPTFMTREYSFALDRTAPVDIHNVITICVELTGERSCANSGPNLIRVVDGATETLTVNVMPSALPKDNPSDARLWRAVHFAFPSRALEPAATPTPQ